MTALGRILCLGLAVGMSLALADRSAADDPPAITQVVAIDTNGKLDQLLSHAKSNAKIFERLGIDAERSYMMATLAGSNSGTVVVVIEYKNLAAMAAAQEKLQNDAEWQKYLTEIQESGMSVESNSIWQDITP